MRVFAEIIIYLLFFLSGAAALMYQVVWVRSLGLVFGGSHLAVATVLCVFMAGLAIGGYLIGKRIDTSRRPMMIYGLLELGIALSAVAFIGLMKVYPYFYMLLASGRTDNSAFIMAVRVLFSVAALIVPTTLMGGTLPVLSRFVSGRSGTLAGRLSFLYGLNTLGAVAGAGTAGFFLLRYYSVTSTMAVSISINAIIGLASFAIHFILGREQQENARYDEEPLKAAVLDSNSLFLDRLILWGIGISGFCALGYEVLWTRILTIVVGASVYGFTTMLVAFLTGIAVGSKIIGMLLIRPKWSGAELIKSIFLFGLLQLMVGVSALMVTLYIRDLPVTALRIQGFFTRGHMDAFESRVWADFVIAFLYMIVPALFMGASFPLAAKVHADIRKAVGKAVGDVLAFNTSGAIAGAALSGFAMIYFLGIETSLEMLIILNAGLGFFMMARARSQYKAGWAVPVLSLVLLLVLGIKPGFWRLWDTDYFAIFRNNQPEAFSTAEKVRDAIDNTRVLYYAEGKEAIISSIKVRAGDQAVLVNGKIVASSQKEDRQCQYTLGHLPMLLNRSPEKALVVGLGTGMTLGAVSVHPSLKEVVAVEIEPRVKGAAKTFSEFNHDVLGSPKLKIVYNDGRNYLLTTRDKYDVITADPIHPWAQGASYLYTTEYFMLASSRLRQGGIMCQWLPIYEMSVGDLKSVVKTFGSHFRYSMLWLTYNDAELIGSNEPINLDETEIDRRIKAAPAVSEDLISVEMGSARDLLSYFVIGTEGLKDFSKDGIINTDNNLYLEFSSPLSVGINVMRDNLASLTARREDITRYLSPSALGGSERGAWWAKAREAAEIYDPAHIMALGKMFDSPKFKVLLDRLEGLYGWYAPGRFLKYEYSLELAKEPRLLDEREFVFSGEQGVRKKVIIAAVLAPVSSKRAAVVIVDNASRDVYGQIYVSGPKSDEFIKKFVPMIFGDLEGIYQKELAEASKRGLSSPSSQDVIKKFREAITRRISEYGSSEDTLDR